MLIKEEITIPEQIKESVVAIQCDVCERRQTTFESFETEAYWPGNFEFARTSIYIKEGLDYPTQYSYDCRCYHVCPQCFKNVVEKALIEAGARPTEFSFEN